MLNLQFIVENPDLVRRKLQDRGEDPPIERIVDLDARRRRVQFEADELRARRNEVSRAIGKAGGRPGEEQVNEMREVGARIREIETDLETVQEELDGLLLGLPNLPKDAVPVGPDESANALLRSGTPPPDRDFAVEPNWDFAARTGIFDLAAGARMSGARFYVLTGKGAALQRALVQWMLSVHTGKNGYTEIAPPFLVREETIRAAGELPKFAENLYRDDEDDLWLIPTSEVALGYLHAGEIIDPGLLPLKYVAHSHCFRREKTAAGRDTRGIKRVRQFEKVEMYRFVEPEHSEAALEEMTEEAIYLIEQLELPWRLVALASGDISFQSSQTLDIEVWAPGSEEWLEVSSLSNCTDFQARRSRTRYRPETGAPARLVHTLNGSGLPLPRILIAILENHMQADGAVRVPDVLRPYTGFDFIP